MVLMQKVALTELRGEARPASIKLSLERDMAGTIAMRAVNGAFLFNDSAGAGACLAIQGTGIQVMAASHAQEDPRDGQVRPHRQWYSRVPRETPFAARLGR